MILFKPSDGEYVSQVKEMKLAAMPAYSGQCSFYHTTFEIHIIVIVSIYLVTSLIAMDLKLMSQVTISNLFSKFNLFHFENKIDLHSVFTKIFVFL